MVKTNKQKKPSNQKKRGKSGTQNKQDQKETLHMIANFKPITLKVNELNIPIKRQKLSNTAI